MAALRDPEQARRALQLANDTRLCVAQFKRDIAGLDHYDAVITVVDAIECRYDDKLLGAAKVRHLLMAVPRLGDHKARKLIQVAQIYNGDKRLRDLTERQRKLLVDVLTREGWKRRDRRAA